MKNVFLDRENKKVCFIIDGTAAEFSNWEELNQTVLELKLAGNKVFGPEFNYDEKKTLS